MVMAGPALLAAASPVMEKRPAPIMAPIPRATSEPAPSDFLRPFSVSAASAIKILIGFLTNKLILLILGS
jgi:hypothetical protein